MGTFYRRQLPTTKRTRKRQGRFRRRGVNRDGRGAFGGWVLSAVMDKKKEGRPFRAGPLLVRLYESLPCRCSYTIAHFAVVVNNFLVAAGAFVCCCIRVACGRPLEVRSRPRAGGGWALPAGLACAITPGPRRAACGPGREPAATVCAVRRSCRVACLPWPGPPRSFGGPWSRVSACCWDGPKEQRALWWLRTKRPLTKRGRVWYS